LPASPPSARWDPWSALRARSAIEFRLDPIAALLGGGFYARRGDQRAIVLDPALDRRRRRTALAHELIHDERGTGCDAIGAPRAWAAVIGREEASVDAEVARRLVPPGELLAVARASAELGDGLVAWQVADEFDVDEETAARALHALARSADSERAAPPDPMAAASMHPLAL